jgi:hypothetical protein
MKAPKALFAFLTGICMIAISCDKENKTVPVQILLTDNPVDYDSVNIHLETVKVKMNNDNAGWTELDAVDTTVNLLDLQNGVTMVLAQGNIPDGLLREVRFILGPGSYVVVNGARHDLETPSAEHSGLKIKIDKELDESLNTFTLDFDAAQSIQEQNGQYKLHPVIQLRN